MERDAMKAAAAVAAVDEVAAGTIFGVFSASMSFFMLFVGFVADSMGIKKALIVGLLIALYRLSN